MNLTPTQKPLIITPRDEQILKAVYYYRYMTSLDVAHRFFKPSYMPYVRGRMARLSGGKDQEENSYLYRFKLPSTDGNKERIFTLGTLGRRVLENELGYSIDWFFKPGKTKFFSYSASLHHVLLTRFAVACLWWYRNLPGLGLFETRISYEIESNPPEVRVMRNNKQVSIPVIPDCWMLFKKNESNYAVIFELDRGMEFQAKFKQHVRNRLELIESGEYERYFGVPGVIVAYLTTGQTPEYRKTRVKTMNLWTRQVLAEVGLEDWASLFRFTSIEFDNLYEKTPELFETAVWMRPDSSEGVLLFE